MDRLSEFFSTDGDPDLTPDETLRYLNGELSEEERAEIDAYLAVSPAARIDIADARRQRELERRSLPPITSPAPIGKPGWAGLLGLGLAVGAAAAFAVVCVVSPPTLSDSSRKELADLKRLADDLRYDQQTLESENKDLKEERRQNLAWIKNLNEVVKLAPQAMKNPEIRKKLADYATQKQKLRVAELEKKRLQARLASKQREISLARAEAHRYKNLVENGGSPIRDVVPPYASVGVAVVPIDVTISSSPQTETPRPLPGDSLEAVQKMFSKAWVLDNENRDRPGKLTLLRQAYAMSERLGRPYATGNIGYLLLEDLAMAGDYSGAEPYIMPMVERCRKLIHDKSSGNVRERGLMYMAACYWGGNVYRRTNRFLKALTLIQEGQAFAKLHSANDLLIRFNFEEAFTYQAMGDVTAAMKTWQLNLSLLSKLSEKDSSLSTPWIEQYGLTLSNLAANYYQSGRFAEAVRITDLGLRRRSELKPEITINLLSTRASSNIDLGKFGIAEQDLEEAKVLEAKNPGSSAKIGLEIAYGIFNYEKGRIEDSKSNFQMAHQLAIKFGDDSAVKIAVSIQAVRALKKFKTLENFIK